ncbi:hypothetical protein AGLY_004436 [Aphis glycines]|uniref:Uncharacterized protein n=1 Tax=Aphis glycines TaxID=307491 RepID=A0A6G0TYZ5_APHGL|nr:hypothetical protein AGLY_004436 [Aphis glycines]
MFVLPRSDTKLTAKLNTRFYNMKCRILFNYLKTSMSCVVKYRESVVFELQPYKKIDSVENWFCIKIPVFPSHILKTVGKCLILTCIMHQGYSFFHRKPSPKFEIEALFRLVKLSQTQKKNKHTSLFLLMVEEYENKIFNIQAKFIHRIPKCTLVSRLQGLSTRYICLAESNKLIEMIKCIIYYAT